MYCMLYSYKHDILLFLKQLILCYKVQNLPCHILSNIHLFSFKLNPTLLDELWTKCVISSETFKTEVLFLLYFSTKSWRMNQ